ncbi:MAG: OmpA family protein [Bacteroidetes bacterium]|nr:OmpA family protein [Bacteroidota bacterium]
MKFPSYLLLTLCISGCSILKSEPAATADATPPPGYNPVYITGIKKITSPPTERPAFYLSRSEATEPNRIRLFSHMVDSAGNYLSGASSSKLRSMWCRLTDVCAGRTDIIKDFKLREVSENDHIPTAIVLAMDHSGSMGEPRALAVQEAASKFISMKMPEDAFALIKYDGHIGVESPLSNDGQLLQSRLQKTGLTGFGGFTAIGDAIESGIDLLAKTQGYDRKAIVVFTDGKDNSSTLTRDSVIRNARRNGVIVCAVDFGENIDPGYMTEVANSTGGIHEQVYRTGEFESVFQDLYRKLKNYYVIEYTPRSYGQHTVSMKLCLPRDTAIAERTFDNSPKAGEVAFLDITFNVDQADIQPASEEALTNAEYLLKAFPTMTVEVRGHTDNTGDSQHNKTLSERRAQAVRAALVKRGVAANRIVAKGFGDSMPIADNSTEDGRARNRRTEFVILTQ